jgi:ATP-dependent DNA helicase RecQ
MLTKPMEVKKARAPRAGEIECDEGLFDRLRKLRKRLGDERGVPAYMVCGDNSLRQMARDYPTDADSLHGVAGLGEKKVREFGAAFAREVSDYLKTYPRMDFAGRGAAA